jgi:protein involved in polysaccharide export with SLBB domain
VDKMWIQLSLYQFILGSFNRIPMFKFLMIIFSVLGMTACSGDWTHYPASSAIEKNKELVIHPNDILTVSVFDETQISGNYQVSQVGNVNLPLIGTVHVAGEEAQSAEKKIALSLTQNGYFIDPKVTVSFVQDHTIYILGEVLESGEFNYRSGMTILDLVAKARGFSYRANQNRFDIIRQKVDGSEEHIDGDIATHLLPNDTIRVRERYF